MPRTLWNGSLSFGLVNVPVQPDRAPRATSTCTSASCTRRTARRSSSAASAPRRTRRSTGRRSARGYELDNGKQVVLTDEELASVQPRKTRTIDIESFVDLEEVDPIYFDHPWFLVPSGESEGTKRAYQLLVEVMESTERAALGRFVMRSKEYLVLVRPRDGLLSLTTLLFGDEVRPTDGDRARRAQAHQEEGRPGRGGDRVARRPTGTPSATPTATASASRAWSGRRRRARRSRRPTEPKQPKPAPDLMEALEADAGADRAEPGKLSGSLGRSTARRCSSSSMLRPVTISTIGPVRRLDLRRAPPARRRSSPRRGGRPRRTRRPPARWPARRPARTECRGATSSSTASGTATRTAKPSANVLQRSHSTGRPASTLSAITGASFGTTPTRGRSVEPARDPDQQRAVADRHDRQRRRLPQLLDDLLADRRVALELSRLRAVLEERQPARARAWRRAASLASSTSAPTWRSSAPSAPSSSSFAWLTCSGTYTTARRPTRCAAQAVAAPWLPVEAVTTSVAPAPGSAAATGSAPRHLNAPSSCGVLALQQQPPPGGQRGRGFLEGRRRHGRL